MSQTQVFIYTDSRGAGLQRYIRRNDCFMEGNVSVTVQAGGTIEHLTRIMKQKVQTLKQTYFGTIFFIMAAGICNFTEKVHLKNHEYQIIYEHKLEKIETIKAKLSYIYNYMSINNVNFKAVHIPSSCLLKSKMYNVSKGKLSPITCIMSDGEILQQQQLLESDISIVNEHISHLNEVHLRRSVRWDRNLVLCKQKLRGRLGNKKKNHQCIIYDNLYDGVHPNPSEAAKWYTFLCKSIQLDIQDFAASDIVTNDSWDFKRQK